jgi:Mg-chelatase subunit ChlD
MRVELAADATLRAMALRRSLTGGSTGPILADLRTKVRLRRAGSLIVFAIDASDSMNVQRRMAVAKGAVMALLVTAQVTGDRVALVAFEGEGADIVLQPTASMARARARLQRLPTGGATPLAAGMAHALAVVRSERRRDPLVRPRIVLSSDGEANVPRSPGADVREELDALADEIRKEGIDSVVLDSNPRFSSSAALQRLAGRLGASYHAIHELDVQRLTALITDW